MDRRTAFLNEIVQDPHNRTTRLVFADWLEENGDPLWARYIRVRCALDDQAPEPDTYPTLVEEHLEAAEGRREPEFKLPPGFSLGTWWSGDSEEWWSDDSDAMEGGLLSFVDAQEDPQFATHLQELVETTPVRGIDFEGNLVASLPAIFGSPAGQKLKRIAFNANQQGQDPIGPSAAVQALVESPLARTLERLEFGGGLIGTLSNANAQALAKAPFENLKRLEMLFSNCSPEVLEELMTAPWFRNLHRLRIGVHERSAEVCGKLLGGMQQLHTLGLWMPKEGTLRALADGDFPNLRRLFIHCGSLKGECGKSLGSIRAPRLIELWLRNCSTARGDLQALAGTPLFDDLRVLTLDGTKIAATALKAIAARPSAARLRILRIQAMDEATNIASLAATPLTDPRAFPALTTLTLTSPYGRKVKPGDLAEFLANLATPNLRHLALAGNCGLDESCLQVLATRDTFAKLTRLRLEGHDNGGKFPEISPATARKFFTSAYLQGLVELRIQWCNLTEGASVLADPAVLPNLRSCGLPRGVPAPIRQKLKKTRPCIYCPDY